MTVEGTGVFRDAQSGEKGDTRSSRALRSLNHNNTSPLYENPVSLYAQLQHCSANHVGKERITILLSTWPRWDRVGEIGPVHTVTKGESAGVTETSYHIWSGDYTRTFYVPHR